MIAMVKDKAMPLYPYAGERIKEKNINENV